MLRLLRLLILSVLIAAPAPVVRAEVEVQSAIFGYRWTITAYWNGERLRPPDLSLPGQEAPLPPLEITLGFDANVSGTAGCGALVGRYRLEGTDLRIEPGYLLGGACTEEHFMQQALILEALGEVRHVERDGNRLELSGADGRVLLVLER